MLLDFPVNNDENKKSAHSRENVEIDHPKFPDGQRSRQSAKYIPCEPNVKGYFYPKPFGEVQVVTAQDIKEIYQYRATDTPLVGLQIRPCFPG